MLTFIIGMMVGGIIGFFAFCLLTAGKDSDRYEEYEELRFSKKSQIASVEDTNADVKKSTKPTNAAQGLREVTGHEETDV